jgi:hypothetical protein
VAFRAESVDDFLGEQAHRAVRPTVVAQVALTISFKTLRAHTNRMNDLGFGHASVRDLDRLDATHGRSANGFLVVLVPGHEKRKITRSELTAILFRIHTVGRPEGPSTFPAGRQFWRIHV